MSLAAGILAASLLMLGAFAVIAFSIWNPEREMSPPTSSQHATAVLEEPVAFVFNKDIDAEAAVVINAAAPNTTEPILPARSFALSKRVDPATRLAAIDCLTAAVYYEAASEGYAGQRAVAQVVLNRMRHPAYPNSICGVVFQGSDRKTGCQFTFTCDGALGRRPSSSGWAAARSVALAALAGYVEPSVGLATHYHTRFVVPYWTVGLTRLRPVGDHIFYRWNGGAGSAKAFNRSYASNEAIPAPAAARLASYLLTSARAVNDVEEGQLSAERVASEAHSPPQSQLREVSGSALRAETGNNFKPAEFRLKSDDTYRLLETGAKLAN